MSPYEMKINEDDHQAFRRVDDISSVLKGPGLNGSNMHKYSSGSKGSNLRNAAAAGVIAIGAIACGVEAEDSYDAKANQEQTYGDTQTTTVNPDATDEQDPPVDPDKPVVNNLELSLYLNGAELKDGQVRLYSLDGKINNVACDYEDLGRVEPTNYNNKRSKFSPQGVDQVWCDHPSVPRPIPCELDAELPEMSIDPLVTNDSTPQLTGKIADYDALVEITINEQVYTAVNNGDGTWILENDTITDALADGDYDVKITATYSDDSKMWLTETGFLKIDTSAPPEDDIIDSDNPMIDDLCYRLIQTKDLDGTSNKVSLLPTGDLASLIAVQIEYDDGRTVERLLQVPADASGVVKYDIVIEDADVYSGDAVAPVDTDRDAQPNSVTDGI
ncbi:Ig-like domain-containing protein [Nanoarchaeota archaeon]